MHGQHVCKVHGGLIPRAKAAGLRRVAEAKAQTSVAKRFALRGVQLPADVHAPTVMLQELAAAVAQAEVIAELVEQADQIIENGEPTALARMLIEAHHRISRQATEITKLGISAAAISAAQAQATAAEWRAAIKESGVSLSREDQDRLAEAFVERLRRRLDVPRIGHE
jgi:hypothetical protein